MHIDTFYTKSMTILIYTIHILCVVSSIYSLARHVPDRGSSVRVVPRSRTTVRVTLIAIAHLSSIGNVCVVRLVQLAQLLPSEFTRDSADCPTAVGGTAMIYHGVILI